MRGPAGRVRPWPAHTHSGPDASPAGPAPFTTTMTGEIGREIEDLARWLGVALTG